MCILPALRAGGQSVGVLSAIRGRMEFGRVRRSSDFIGASLAGYDVGPGSDRHGTRLYQRKVTRWERGRA